MQDILCLMGLFPQEYITEIQADSKVGLQNAANKLQWAIVDGLDSIQDCSVGICNSLYIGPYPKRYRTKKIPSFKFEHNGIRNADNIGFVNLPFIKMFSRYNGIKKYVNKWANNGSAAQKVLIIYALTTPFVWIASYVCNRYKNVKVCIVVPDLPEYMNVTGMQKKRMYAFLKSTEIRIIRHCIKNVRYYVLLTDAMKTWFGREIKYTVVEGISHPEEIIEGTLPDEPIRNKNIIYAGGIKREYGVADLVSAFCRIDEPDWNLTIYGDGTDLEYVKQIAEGDSRVHFMGVVNNSEVVKELRKATLLINPRKNQEMAKYSFPSKIIEYMSSGTPLLAYKLDGVPAEYDAFYYPIEDTDSGMETALRTAMSKSESELIDFGKRAKAFVLSEKNPKRQCEKIIALLSE